MAYAKQKSKTKKSSKKKPLWLVILIIVIAVGIYILTPTTNPLETTMVISSEFNEEICLPANDGNIIYHPHYWLSYNESDEQPNWVATVLTAEHVLMETPDRADNFREDPLVVTGSATLSDYRGSGYDRGHLLSYASNGWNAEVGDASFFLSNMSPQTHAFNAGIWLELEKAERQATVQNGVLYVVSGPVLTDGPFETIGASKVAVPNTFYKVFLDYTGSETKAIGFIMPHENSSKPLSSFACSVDEVERITGLDFFAALPDADEKALESVFDASLWDLGDFSRASAARKYGYDLNNLSSSETIVETSIAQPENFKQTVQYLLYTWFADIKLEINATLGL